MLETFFWIMVGAFVGWNLPQPSWAVQFQEKHLQKYINMIPFISQK